MRSEGHYLGIRKLEGREAELRARAADAGQVVEDQSMDDVDRLLKLLKLLELASDPEATAGRLNEIAAAATRSKAEIQAGWQELNSARAAHEKNVAEQRQAWLRECDAREKEIAAKEAEIEQRNAKSRSDANLAAQNNSAAAQLRSKLEAKLKLIDQAQSL